MNELNRIIDEDVPASRPRFQRDEVIIGGEVCEVFFRDVIECIRALYSDPEFAKYMVFAPEKHFTDEEKETRMYHDMHTGRWWWGTQASLTHHSRRVSRMGAER